jgi:hypothetical protein
VTNAAGNVVKRYDYLPFGEEIPASSYSRGTAYSSGGYPATADPANAPKFTGKKRDANIGLERYTAGAVATPPARSLRLS